MLYLGGLMAGRGLEQLVDAIALVRRRSSCMLGAGAEEGAAAGARRGQRRIGPRAAAGGSRAGRGVRVVGRRRCQPDRAVVPELPLLAAEQAVPVHGRRDPGRRQRLSSGARGGGGIRLRRRRRHDPARGDRQGHPVGSSPTPPGLPRWARAAGRRWSIGTTGRPPRRCCASVYAELDDHPEVG